MTGILELLAFFSAAALVLIMFWFGLIGCLGLPVLTLGCWSIAAWGGVLAFRTPFTTDPIVRSRRAGWRLVFGVAVALTLTAIVEHPGTDKQTYRPFYWVLAALLPLALAFAYHLQHRHQPTGADTSTPNDRNA